jgi:serine/threonine-protein kinase
MEGRNVNGYEIIEYIGKGQFGTVYKCKRSESIYAIKIFNLEYVDVEYRQHGDDNRINREINALKMVDHENVIMFIDEGVYEENGQFYVYVVMECLEGIDLQKYLYANNLNLKDIKEIFIQILEGLNAVHEKNIVHRDLKPQNIFITKNNIVKILDFGLSKLIDFTSITSTGDIIGSPIYMSPEQVKDSKNIDYRSDYYALGVILFELITKTYPYGDIASREQLYFNIIHEKPLSVLQIVPSTPNYIDNLIVSLLNKENYKRPNSKEAILKYLSFAQPADFHDIPVTFEPCFYLRTYNEKSVLKEYYKDGYTVENVIFPINHQKLQKNLLKHIKDNNVNFIIDPSTMRLAYDTFADIKGLVELPYAPQGYARLELGDFAELDQKKKYVNMVVEAQLQHDPGYVVAPFHVSNNTNFVSIKNANIETWFSLDIKLLKETKDYLLTNKIDKMLVGGFCIKADILTTNTEREYFLNVLTGLPCDMYWLYVDCINYETGAAQVYQYISTLLELQKSTSKPVIAGRVGTIGLLLLAFGLYAFESGSARFESFYEDLYKESMDPYNMYVMYYIPELMKNVPVERKNPSKIISILGAKCGIDLRCNCPYCQGKQPDELINDSNTKKHFLYRRHEEIMALRSMSIPRRLDYIEERIRNAIAYYKELMPIFKESDYSYLKAWQRVVPDLRKVYQL